MLGNLSMDEATGCLSLGPRPHAGPQFGHEPLWDVFFTNLAPVQREINKIYGQQALKQQRSHQPNTHFLTFYVPFSSFSLFFVLSL